MSEKLNQTLDINQDNKLDKNDVSEMQKIMESVKDSKEGMQQYVSALSNSIHKLNKNDAQDLANACDSVLNGEQNLAESVKQSLTGLKMQANAISGREAKVEEKVKIEKVGEKSIENGYSDILKNLNITKRTDKKSTDKRENFIKNLNITKEKVGEKNFGKLVKLTEGKNSTSEDRDVLIDLIKSEALDDKNIDTVISKLEKGEKLEEALKTKEQIKEEKNKAEKQKELKERFNLSQLSEYFNINENKAKSLSEKLTKAGLDVTIFLNGYKNSIEKKLSKLNTLYPNGEKLVQNLKNYIGEKFLNIGESIDEVIERFNKLKNPENKKYTDFKWDFNESITENFDFVNNKLIPSLQILIDSKRKGFSTIQNEESLYDATDRISDIEKMFKSGDFEKNNSTFNRFLFDSTDNTSSFLRKGPDTEYFRKNRIKAIKGPEFLNEEDKKIEADALMAIMKELPILMIPYYGDVEGVKSDTTDLFGVLDGITEKLKSEGKISPKYNKLNSRLDTVLGGVGIIAFILTLVPVVNTVSEFSLKLIRSGRFAKVIKRLEKLGHSKSDVLKIMKKGEEKAGKLEKGADVKKVENKPEKVDLDENKLPKKSVAEKVDDLTEDILFKGLVAKKFIGDNFSDLSKYIGTLGKSFKENFVKLLPEDMSTFLRMIGIRDEKMQLQFVKLVTGKQEFFNFTKIFKKTKNFEKATGNFQQWEKVIINHPDRGRLKGQIIEFKGNKVNILLKIDGKEKIELLDLKQIKKIEKGTNQKITIENFSKLEKSEDTIKFLNKFPELKPKNHIEIGGKDFLFSDINIETFPSSGGKVKQYKQVVGYVEVDGKIETRLFYKSNSDGGWRASPGERSDGGYSKGEYVKKIDNNAGFSYTTTTKIDDKLNNYIDTLEISNDKSILNSFSKYHTEVDSNFPLHQNTFNKETNIYDDKGDLKIFRDEGSAGHLKEDFKNYSKEEIVSHIHSLDNKYPEGFIPDFSKKPIRTETINHTIVGETKIEVFEGILNGEKVEWHMAQNIEKPEMIWISNIKLENSKINSFGVDSEFINSGILTNKPFEYGSQLPVSLLQNKMEGRYFDITDIIGELKPVKEYKNRNININNKISKLSNKTKLEGISNNKLLYFNQNMDSVSSNFINNLGEAYKPEYSVKIEGKEFLLTDKFTGTREDIIGYTKVNGVYEPRLFYFSQSGGNWHVSAGIRKDNRPNGTVAYAYSKGEEWKLGYEKGTVLNSELADILGNIPKGNENIGNFENLYENLGFSSKIIQKETKEVNRVNVVRGSDNQSFAYLQDDDLNIQETKNVFSNVNVVGLDMNFKNIRKGESMNHKHLGSISTDIAETKLNGKDVEIIFAKADNNPNLVWIEDIRFKNAKINSFGFSSEKIEGGLLTAKPIEYTSQLPYNIRGSLSEYGEFDAEEGYHTYSDIRELMQGNPLIKEYKNQLNSGKKQPSVSDFGKNINNTSEKLIKGEIYNIKSEKINLEEGERALIYFDKENNSGDIMVIQKVDGEYIYRYWDGKQNDISGVKKVKNGIYGRKKFKENGQNINNKVSKEHIQININNGILKITDISTNGTRLQL